MGISILSFSQGCTRQTIVFVKKRFVYDVMSLDMWVFQPG